MGLARLIVAGIFALQSFSTESRHLRHWGWKAPFSNSDIQAVIYVAAAANKADVRPALVGIRNRPFVNALEFTAYWAGERPAVLTTDGDRPVDRFGSIDDDPIEIGRLPTLNPLSDVPH